MPDGVAEGVAYSPWKEASRLTPATRPLSCSYPLWRLAGACLGGQLQKSWAWLSLVSSSSSPGDESGRSAVRQDEHLDQVRRTSLTVADLGCHEPWA
jgi:hypothetical protein